MPTYQRRTRIAAPLEAVWEFYSHVDGLVSLTPEFLNLRVEAVRGPDGERDPEVLTVGTQIRTSVRPFGVGPRQRWTSRIVEREEREGSTMFRDVMVDGPFRRWVHTHRFEAVGDATVLDDCVEYRFPGGVVGDAVGPLAGVGFEPMFRYRHRKTKELLE